MGDLTCAVGDQNSTIVIMIYFWSSSIIFPLDKGTCFSLINQSKVLWVHLSNLLLLSIFFIWYKFGNIILQVFNITRNIGTTSYL